MLGERATVALRPVITSPRFITSTLKLLLSSVRTFNGGECQTKALPSVCKDLFIKVSKLSCVEVGALAPARSTICNRPNLSYCLQVEVGGVVIGLAVFIFPRFTEDPTEATRGLLDSSKVRSTLLSTYKVTTT